MRRGLSFAVVLGMFFATQAPSPAHAGGFEFAGPGTRALGRGGAFAARADDPMALFYNPANLADLAGIQLALNVHVAFNHACFHRSGGWADEDGVGIDTTSRFGDPNSPPPDGFFGLSYPRVCNSGPPGIIPELIFTWRINEQLGVGAGLLAPAAVGHTVWGSVREGTVNVDGVPTGTLPSPARYALIEDNIILAYPSVGVAYRPHPRFRFGATFGWGIGVFDFTDITVPVAGEGPSSDIYTELHATDFFVPRVTVSAHTVPHDNIDIMVGFTWNGDIAASGRTDFNSGYYTVASRSDVTARSPDCPPMSPTGAWPPCRQRVDHTHLDAPQPWQLTLGLRYADRISPRPQNPTQIGRLSHRIEDPMANERWDVELDAVYERNSLVDYYRVSFPPYDPALPAGSTIPTSLGPMTPVPNVTVIPHHYKDQVSLRLGGDYNVIPGMAAVRLGFSFETDGQNDSYNGLDFMPHMRLGVHAGLTARIGKLDVSLAYAYLHNFSETVSDAPCADGGACARQVAAQGSSDPYVRASETGSIVNAGTYSSHLNVVSLGVSYNFQ